MEFKVLKRVFKDETMAEDSILDMESDPLPEDIDAVGSKKAHEEEIGLLEPGEALAKPEIKTVIETEEVIKMPIECQPNGADHEYEPPR